jgi:LPXTG-motif cell wall-anchored protein
MLVPINGAFGSMDAAYGDAYGASYGASSWLAERRRNLKKARQRVIAATKNQAAQAQSRGYLVPTSSAAQAGSAAWTGRTRFFQKPGFVERYQSLPTAVKAGTAAMIPGIGPWLAAGILGKKVVEVGTSRRKGSVGTSIRKGPGGATVGRGPRGTSAYTTANDLYAAQDAFSQGYPAEGAATSSETAVAEVSAPSYGLMAVGALLLAGAGYALFKRFKKGKKSKSKK